MKIMNRKNSIIVLLFLVTVMMSGINVQAKDDTNTFQKQYAFTTSDKNEKHDKEFDKEVTKHGKKYKLTDIKYDVQNKTPEVTEKEVEKVIESDYIADGTNYVPQQEITENGINYKYDHKEPLLDTSKQEVSGYTDYDYEVSESTVPQTKEITVNNNITGNDETVTCNLTGVQQLNGEWQDTYIDITFISYDSEVFEWNGIEVLKNETSPLKGYESELLASVGANTTDYRVKGISWNGDTYTRDDGTLCRDAKATVQRYVKYYRASYSGTLNAGTKFRVVYKGTEKIISKDKFNYNIIATGTYTEEQNLVPYYVAAGVGIFLILSGIVLGLYLIAKKKKEKNS